MKNNKISVLFTLSAICFVLFIISLFTLLTGDASDSSTNWGLPISIIGGIVIVVPVIIEIVKQYSNYKEEQSIIPFAIACLKKENGNDMFKLMLSLAFCLSPVVIFIGVLIIVFSSGSNGTGNSLNNIGKAITNADNSTDSTRNTQSANTQSADTSVASSENANITPSIPSTYEEIRRLADRSSNDIKHIGSGEFNEIRKEYMKNPGITVEELTYKLKKQYGVNSDLFISEETVRACMPREMSYEEVDKAACNSSNKISRLYNTPPCNPYGQFCRIVKEHPGASDAEIAKIASTNEETVRAYRNTVKLTVDDVNMASRLSSNNIEKMFEAKGKYKRLVNAIKENPGASDAKIAQAIDTNEETVRAYRKTL